MRRGADTAASYLTDDRGSGAAREFLLQGTDFGLAMPGEGLGWEVCCEEYGCICKTDDDAFHQLIFVDSPRNLVENQNGRIVP